MTTAKQARQSASPTVRAHSSFEGDVTDHQFFFYTFCGFFLLQHSGFGLSFSRLPDFSHALTVARQRSGNILRTLGKSNRPTTQNENGRRNKEGLIMAPLLLTSTVEDHLE